MIQKLLSLLLTALLQNEPKAAASAKRGLFYKTSPQLLNAACRKIKGVYIVYMLGKTMKSAITDLKLMALTKRKATVFAIALLLLSMPLMTLSISLVQADAGGTGKFLTVEIVGEGYVTATKVQSGETWNFYQNGTEKVGAGTVLLQANASEGWEFSQWGGELAGISENPTEYKTAKYGYVLATFVKKIYTITAYAIGNGTINPLGGMPAKYVEVPVEYGASQTFEFTPDTGNHTSAILVDTAYLGSFAQSYTFEYVTADHTIKVYFSAAGTATVPAGNDVTAFLDSGAGLTFSNTDGGTATGENVYYPVGGATAWDINVTFTFTGEVNVTLVYNDTGLSLQDEQNLRLIRGDSAEAIRSDVNHDLVVDGTDVSIVANAVKQGEWYNPLLDINNDGFVDETDIHIVNANKGAILEDITDGINTDLNIIWGTTGHFSIFGVR
jgi:hypothetical protein